MGTSAQGAHSPTWNRILEPVPALWVARSRRPVPSFEFAAAAELREPAEREARSWQLVQAREPAGQLSPSEQWAPRGQAERSGASERGQDTARPVPRALAAPGQSGERQP